MADLTAIRNALGAQITAGTGLRSMPQARDQVSPPVAVILPRAPLITYGETLGPENPNVPGAYSAVLINLQVVLILSDAAPSEKTQRALDAYLGIGAGEGASVAGAIMADPSLSGAVHWCLPMTVAQYGRIEYAGETYFGASVNVQVSVT